MSAERGVNRILFDTPDINNRAAKGIFDARRKSIVDVHEAVALALGSTIKMGGLLPKGARIKEMILHTDNLGNNTTLAVGDSDTTDRYILATDHGAGNPLITRITIAQIAGRDYVIGTNTGDNQIVITTAGGEAGGTIKLEIVYTQD